MRLPLLIMCLGLAIPGAASAITYLDGVEKDPIQVGAKCDVNKLMSYGSYVFQWPTKYDAVFSPWMDRSMMWSCKKSGYVSFASDFEEISPDERARIADWLARNPTNFSKLSINSLLDRMEQIYRLRNKDDDFWSMFYRQRAVYALTVQEGDSWRAKALPLMKHMLLGQDLSDPERMEKHYLVGYYSWRAGDKAAALASFDAMKTMGWTDKELAKETVLQRFQELADDVKAGKLDGVCGQVLTETEGCPLVEEARREAAERSRSN